MKNRFIVALAAVCAFLGFGALFAPNALASTTYVDCGSNISGLGFQCTQFTFSRNANGDRVVWVPAVEVHNTSTRTDVLASCDYFWIKSGYPVRDHWVPQYSVPSGGSVTIPTPDGFRSWGYADPGMGTNCGLANSATNKVFSLYSTDVG